MEVCKSVLTFIFPPPIPLYFFLGKVTCPACKGRGLVICRDCFSLYDEDPADIEAIREKMRRMPD